ncbi:hypothetical protein Clacol_008774 [Clathrus columnatus]|uniref:3-isopropylmalate dehydratase n=1 Tax=Clathrus columnatus TaxID=1419009 RepID=A0AAV5ANU9_9AGAM|nr:hypothetical protein Clacol_008774 [Clathrus columnatus]
MATTPAAKTLRWFVRHIIHEATTAQAFASIRENNRSVRRPDLTLATTDHIVPTKPRKHVKSYQDYYKGDPKAEELCLALEKNAVDFGMHFYPLNDKRQGIVHIIAPEQGFILPGTTCVCGDSHTSTHGAFGALAFGIGTSEVEHVLATQVLWQKRSKNMRISIEGTLHESVSSKDVILHIIGKIGTAGGTGCVIEYAGSVIRNLSMDARMSICNMSIEAGARAGLIAPDNITINYLKGLPFSPKPGDEWDKAENYWKTLYSDKDAKFDIDITIDAQEISPCITWGTSPQDVVPITGSVPYPESFQDDPNREEAVRRSLTYMDLRPGTQMEDIAIDKVFIGSCTNGRIEDLRSVASVILAAGPDAHVSSNVVQALIVPGSGIVRQQAEFEGLDVIFERAGFDWREAGCSMCCGLNQDRLKVGERCASTSNRNFEGRQGSGGRTHLLSPIMAAAAALNGRLTDVRKYGVLPKLPGSSSQTRQETTTSTNLTLSQRNEPVAAENVNKPSTPKNQTATPETSTTKDQLKFTILRGIAAPFSLENINTDVILSVQFLTGVKRSGYGQYLFNALRFSPSTGERSDFILNRVPFNNSSIIVCTGRNFGCGSSREAAVWSLKEFGIKCIIAPSFGEIFENNCVKNGVLPITLTLSKCKELYTDAEAALPLEIDLTTSGIRRPGSKLAAIPFKIDPFRQHCLLHGLDDIGLTIEKLEDITLFEQKRRSKFPWIDNIPAPSRTKLSSQNTTTSFEW